MDPEYRRMTEFLRDFGVEDVPHTQKTYLGHLIAVQRVMESRGCSQDVCRAGMFHSIYGTERFQGFKLPLERRDELRTLIGERPERLAYWNCAMDRVSFDRALEQGTEPFQIIDRITGDTITMSRSDFDDLCRVHLFDWLEQAPRSSMPDYRRAAYRAMADHLGGEALEEYHRVLG